ncbi:PRC-barrel domain-containing protein [Tessaracoccus sp. MC1865]|uniref:PRC-barrel domain-containing protein n=1 Tax=Tessaracoccus sp. MC1865 TaxID=2760310 RepID=UPI001603C698|nr:PRC-barrel domain-containing protein [Tessaracoccus sp. MC1865]MBB1482709.1 PRC-barrel domain-containing protein [Tessaracoccus sp. MC1865]QTO37842.1 PRC-barrel domain-containing protein [Tessaracoccus sp. MC1865]
MHHDENIDQLLGATAYDRSGEKIGGVSGVYLDDQTSQPMWVTVNTGLFGLRTSFAPLAGSSLEGDRLTLAHDKDTVKDAPNVDEDGHITRSQEDDLYRYYQVDSSVIEEDRLRTRRWDRDHDLSGEERSDGPLLDSDRDGRGPVGEVLDGPDHTHDPARSFGDGRTGDNAGVHTGSLGSPGVGNERVVESGSLGSPGMGNENVRSRQDDLISDPAYRNDPSFVDDQAAVGGERYVDDERLRDDRLRDVGPDGELVDDEAYPGDDVSGYPDAAEGPLGERTRGQRPIDNIFDAPDQGNPRPN